ncbi:hypothetical protein BT96DRAFT_306060 [Gymnopus androsaceus JB14]|uniref:F-box domain-containing protein n=1 Tax=Gymnopus androsaceus JB14 TaxID=1447944 RepID=A0A6A4IAM1_9AGAR|nr:hypothetical protein BT96DRAFT_306060 [Gymnopus androsaceus JB14]
MSNLPRELINLFFEEISLSDAKRCILVCKQWQPSAELRIYRCAVTGRPESASVLDLTLARKPYLCSFIHGLSLVSGYPFSDILLKFIPAHLPRMDQLHSLSLLNMASFEWRVLVKLLPGLIRLKSVSIHTRAPITASLHHEMLKSLGLLPSLRDLGYSSPVVGPAPERAFNALNSTSHISDLMGKDVDIGLRPKIHCLNLWNTRDSPHSNFDSHVDYGVLFHPKCPIDTSQLRKVIIGDYHCLFLVIPHVSEFLVDLCCFSAANEMPTIEYSLFYNLESKWDLLRLQRIHLHVEFDAAILFACLQNAPSLETIIFIGTHWQDPIQNAQTTNTILRKADKHLASTSAFPSLSQIDVLCSNDSGIAGQEAQLLLPLFSNLQHRSPGKVLFQFRRVEEYSDQRKYHSFCDS